MKVMSRRIPSRLVLKYCFYLPKTRSSSFFFFLVWMETSRTEDQVSKETISFLDVMWKITTSHQFLVRILQGRELLNLNLGISLRTHFWHFL